MTRRLSRGQYPPNTGAKADGYGTVSVATRGHADFVAIFQAQLVMAPVAPAATGVCDAAFSGSPAGTLAISATVPNGGNVSPGQTVDMTITWDPADWVDLDQFHNCFQINGVTDDSLTYTEKPPATRWSSGALR